MRTRPAGQQHQIGDSVVPACDLPEVRQQDLLATSSRIWSSALLMFKLPGPRS